ncbi:MAG: triose-phosphate isomerase [Deltaproteobacteria bacterium]|nr:triose-phosphate isomerase [Deltaproteobacteria bacterium]
MRTRVLAGNWKMNFGPAEALAYFTELEKQLNARAPSAPPSQVAACRVIFPPAYALGPEIQKAAARAHVKLGAQNLHWEEKGAFTGELSGATLKSIGIEWVLIAHSERRQFFGETDETAAKRLSRALTLKLSVIYCVGETLAEREAGLTEAVLARQLDAFLSVLRGKLPAGPAILSLAYEPVWAIGTGKTATPDQAQQAHAFLRKKTAVSLGADDAGRLPLLYGGSVTAENAAALLAKSDIDGVLVGGASLKPDQFARILET